MDITFLHELSGQKQIVLPSDIDHNYARPWYKKLNAQQKYPSRLTRFLFLKNFPRHFLSKYPHAFLARHDNLLEVGSSDDLFTDKFEPIEIQEGDTPDLALDTSSWTQQMDRLYYKTLQILQQHYLTTIVQKNLHNSSIRLANLMENTALQLRHSFASIAGWDNDLLIWLNKLFLTKSPAHEHLISIYHEVMQYLNIKLPSLIPKFYSVPPSALLTKSKLLSDPYQDDFTPLKRLPSNPIIVLVPNAPSRTSSQRLEYWKALLSSMGQLININVPYKADQTATELLQLIKLSVRDKIRDIRRKKSNETRPLILVGFNHGSLIAIHAALENPSATMAVVCLGFPLLALNGYRGDLDDPMLDMTTPLLFVIGQMASTATLDGVERLRESMSRTDTGLVLVGGASDKLIVRFNKKLDDGITQAMVDRCIADEVYEFALSLHHNYNVQ